MLKDKKVIATIAVKDLNASRPFYEEKLGLVSSDETHKGVITYSCFDSSLLVYESQYAGGYEATVVTWALGDDLENIVKTLGEKGVVFEHYDIMPGTRREGDIHIFGTYLKNAWFKDPDGNIICLVNI